MHFCGAWPQEGALRHLTGLWNPLPDGGSKFSSPSAVNWSRRRAEMALEIELEPDGTTGGCSTPVGFELGRLLFFACCASLDPALTTRADRWLCLDISAPLNTQIECVLFLCAWSRRTPTTLHLRRYARTAFKPQKPRPRSLPTPPPCAYPRTAGFSAHLCPPARRAGLRVRDDLRVWPRAWPLSCPTPRAAHGGVRLAADGRRRDAHGHVPRAR